MAFSPGCGRSASSRRSGPTSPVQRFPPCPRWTSTETETIVFTQPGRQTLLLSGLSKHASERRSRRGHGVSASVSPSRPERARLLNRTHARNHAKQELSSLRGAAALRSPFGHDLRRARLGAGKLEGDDPWPARNVRPVDDDRGNAERLQPRIPDREKMLPVTSGPASKAKVFISYCSADAAFAERLATDLRATGEVAVWLDTWEVRVGDSILDKISAAIRETDFALFVITPAALNSPWVNREISAATVRELEANAVSVLPVLLEGSELPPPLTGKNYADFRHGYQPAFRQIHRALTSHWRERHAFDPQIAVTVEWQYIRDLQIPARRNDCVLVLTEDSVVRLWTVPELRLVRAYFARDRPADACVSEDGSRITVLTDTNVTIFEAVTGAREVHSFIGTSPVGLATAGDGRYAVLCEDGTVIIRSFSEHARRRLTLKGPQGARRLRAMRSGSFLAFDDTSAWTIDTNSGMMEVARDAGIHTVALAPDQRFLAYGAGAWDGVMIRDLAQPRLEATFRQHTDQVSAVAFSGDGTTLAAGDWDGVIMLYAAPDWKLAGAVRAHERKVGGLAFSPDGAYLVSGGGFDRPALMVWELPALRRVATVYGDAAE